jgi:SAM-dependent methyltransferase
MARVYLDGVDGVDLALASGTRLPFADNTFDLVITSAVILHNAPPIARAIREEIIRVGRFFAAHNEDIDVTYNRYGYDTASWYQDQGIPLAEVGPIPSAPYDSQFCVAELWHR